MRVQIHVFVTVHKREVTEKKRIARSTIANKNKHINSELSSTDTLTKICPKERRKFMHLCYTSFIIYTTVIDIYPRLY